MTRLYPLVFTLLFAAACSNSLWSQSTAYIVDFSLVNAQLDTIVKSAALDWQTASYPFTLALDSTAQQTEQKINHLTKLMSSSCPPGPQYLNPIIEKLQRYDNLWNCLPVKVEEGGQTYAAWQDTFLRQLSHEKLALILANESAYVLDKRQLLYQSTDIQDLSVRLIEEIEDSAQSWLQQVERKQLELQAPILRWATWLEAPKEYPESEAVCPTRSNAPWNKSKRN